MKNILIKVVSFALSFSLGVVLLCTTAMAYKLDINTVSDNEDLISSVEEPISEVISLEDNSYISSYDNSYVNSNSDLSSFETPSYSSEDTLSSNIDTSSVISDPTSSVISDDISSDFNTDTLSSDILSSDILSSDLNSDELISSSSSQDDTLSSSSEISDEQSSQYYESYYSSDYNNHYNNIYSNVDVESRDEINSENWSDIDIVIDSDGKTLNISGANNKGDFSIFKTSAKQTNMKWMFYLAIILIVVGFVGMVYVYFSIRKYKGNNTKPKKQNKLTEI